MSVTIPKNIAQHMLIKKHLPINYDIKHVIDSTGPHAGQNQKERLEKLKKYINRDTSHYLPKFKRAVEFKKKQGRQSLGKILAGQGKRRRKTKKKKTRKKTRKKRKKKRKKKTRKKRGGKEKEKERIEYEKNIKRRIVKDKTREWKRNERRLEEHRRLEAQRRLEEQRRLEAIRAREAELRARLEEKQRSATFKPVRRPFRMYQRVQIPEGVTKEEIAAGNAKMTFVNKKDQEITVNIPKDLSPGAFFLAGWRPKW